MLMGEERGAMVFTDPPYNVPIDGHASGLARSIIAPFRWPRARWTGTNHNLSRPGFSEPRGIQRWRRPALRLHGVPCAPRQFRLVPLPDLVPGPETSISFPSLRAHIPPHQSDIGLNIDRPPYNRVVKFGNRRHGFDGRLVRKEFEF